MRREAYSLAIDYMDRYMLILEKDVSAKQLKLIAMTALMLALKMDDGIMSRKLCHVYINKIDSLLQQSPSKSHRSTQGLIKDMGSVSNSKESAGMLGKSKSQTSIS
jgi:hypothetical protein